MQPTLSEIVEKFSGLVEWVQGSQDLPQPRVSAPDKAEPGTLVFIGDEKYLFLPEILTASAIVTRKDWIDYFVEVKYEGVLISSKNVPLAMANILRTFYDRPIAARPFDGERIHPSAIISETAKIHSTAIVGPLAVISEGCEVGENSYIGAQSTLERNVKVGASCLVHPQVYVGPETVIGDRCEIKPHATIGTEGFGYANDDKGSFRIPHMGKLILESDVHVGSGTQIDRGTLSDSRIGQGTKIDNHCHFGHNINMGKNCIVTGGFISAGSVTVGDNCVIGGRTTVSGHLKIASRVQLAGLTGVTKSIEKSGAYGGYPAQPLPLAMKTTATMVQLPRLRKVIVKLAKSAGISLEDTK